MGDDERQRGRLRKLALKLGTVAGAAAALLAENSASAQDGDVFAGLLNRNDVTVSAPREVGESTKPIAPLVLKPGHGGSKLILAGHRSHSSHSSHSSHRSHVSGSSHSSHFSSSVRPSSGRSTSSPSSSSSNLPGASVPGSAAADASGGDDTPTATPPAASRKGTTRPAPTAPTPPPVDRHDPLLRYQLITLNADKGVPKAFIKDLLVGESRQIEVGETIGDCKLTSISMAEKSIRLKPPTGPEFTLRRGSQGVR